MLSEKGDIIMEAEGTSTVVTKSSKTASQTSGGAVNPGQSGTTTGSSGNKFGGFFAVAVVLQDVDAALKGKGTLQAANGDITISSESTQNVNTQATSAGGSQEQNQEGESVQNVQGMLSNLINGVKLWLKQTAEGAVNQVKTSATEKLNTALGKIEGSSGNTITAQTSEHGSVTAPARAEVGQKVIVKVTVNKGYRLTGLTYTYLPAGSSSYVTKNINISSGSGTYSFEMPASEVILTPIFTADSTSGGSGNEGSGFGDLFETGDGGDQGIGDLVDQGTAGATEETATPANPTRIGQYDIRNFEKKSLTGKLEGSVLSNHVKADAGDTITLTVNPAEGMRLVAGSLKAVYTNESGKKITYTIPRTSAGVYAFTMPVIKAGSVLTFEAAFEKGSADTTGNGKASSSQATGALTVNIVINSNEAYIDTDGSVTAGKKLSVTASANTYAYSVANASGFTEDGAGQTGPVNPVTGEPEDPNAEVTGTQRHGSIVIDTTRNGSIVFKSNNQNPMPGDKVAVAVTAREGYRLQENSVVLTYQKALKDGQGNPIVDPATGKPATASGTIILSYDANTGNYYFTVPADMAEGTELLIRALFEGDLHSLTTVPAETGKGTLNASVSSAKAGDAVKLTVTAKDGYRISRVYYFDTPAGGETAEKNIVELHENADGTWTLKMPNKDVTLKALFEAIDFAGKKYEVKAEVQKTAGKPDGGVIVVPGRADSGDVLTVRVTPDSGYSLVKGSLQAMITKKTGTQETNELIDIAANASGAYRFTVPEGLGENAVITILAKFAQGTQSASGKKLSLGVGVNVSVTKHTNNAYIRKGKITAGDLKIHAASGSEQQPVTSIAESYAGYSEGDIGIGGAVTVHVASAKTTAVILKNAEILLLEDASLDLLAESRERFQTVADAAGTGRSGKVGIGAGIAVAVTGVDVVSGIEDGVSVKKAESVSVDPSTGTAKIKTSEAEPKLKSVSVKAVHSAEERVSVNAGSAGGVSVSPALAVNVSGMRTEAYVGTAPAKADRQWQLSGDLTITSVSGIYREIAANAAAAGGSVGIGASPVITVYNDSSKASLRRSVKADNMRIHSESISKLKSVSRAGSSGAQSHGSGHEKKTGSGDTSGDDSGEGASQRGESDRQADRTIGGAAGLAAGTGSTNIAPGMVSSLTANRQTAQTSEGNVQIAAAFNLNVMKNSSIAVIEGNIRVKTDNELEVSSVGQTEAKIYADGSAVQSKIGVGVAVALNLITYVNQAYIDQAEIIAGSLKILAEMPKEEDSSESGNNEDDTQANTWVQTQVKELLDQAAEKMGLRELFGDDHTEKLNVLLADTAGNAAQVALGTMLVGTPLENMQEMDIRSNPSTLLLFRQLLASNLSETLKANAQTMLAQIGRVLTTAAIDGLFAWLDVDIKRASEGPTNAFVTDAVAGAGASEVGVAGSVAIAVISGTTKAYIGESKNAATVSGDITILADASQSEQTSASSATGNDGKADKNISANPGSQGSGAVGGQKKSIGVGATFALDVIDMIVEAFIGKNRIVTGENVTVKANAQHYRTTVSVSGTDPLNGRDVSAGGSTGTGETTAPKVQPKDIAVDASVAIGLSDLTVKVYVEKNAALTVKKDLTVNALSKSKTLTQASGFSAGDATAVGAAVAVNIATSDVQVIFDGTASVSGAVTIKSYTYNEDDSRALATAVGADIARYLAKFRNVLDVTENNADKIMSGDYENLEPYNTNKNNQTASRINQQLNENSGTANQSGETVRPADNSLSLSANVLRSQGVATESTGAGSAAGGAADLANQQAAGQTSGQGGAANNNNRTEKKSVQAAAAVGVNITKHMAKTFINGTITAGTLLELLADNDSNFRTLGTGATMTLGTAKFSLAVGVAVAVNNNKALVIVGDGTAILLEGKDKVVLRAEASQNMDGDYKGYLGAQALAGSVTEKADAAIGGAVSVLVSKSETGAELGAGSEIRGGDVEVTARDKSKLAVRAGGYSVSAGADVGIGASFAFIYGYNEIFARIMDGAKITARSLKVQALKEKVTDADYKLPVGLDSLITRDESGGTVPTGEQGIVHLTKNGTGANASYTLKLNLGTEKILEGIDLLNFLSSVNYYAEAVSGAVSPGSGKFSGAGSFAMVFFFNDVEAYIGKDVTIRLTGDMTMEAISDATARIIAGSLSASGSKLGVGLTISFLYDDDSVQAVIEDASAKGKTTIQIGGTYTQKAESHMNGLVVTAAASGSAGGNAIGGNFGAIVMDNEAEAAVGKQVSLTADGDIRVSSLQKNDLFLVAASVAGANGQVAAGGTLHVIVNESRASVNAGDGAAIVSKNGSITLSSRTEEDLVSVLASASAASGNGVAGVISVLVTDSDTITDIGKVTLKAKKNIEILADAFSRLFQINAALSASGQNAVGATVSVNVLNRTVLATVASPSVITAENGSVLVRATGDEQILLVVFAGGAAGGNAFTGVVPVIVNNSTVRSEFENGTKNEHTSVTAGDSIGVIASVDSGIYQIAGGLAGAGSNAAGASINTAVLKNNVQANVGTYTNLVITGAPGAGAVSGGIQIPNRNERRHGVVVYAGGREDVILVSVGAAASGNVAVNGVVNTLVVQNIVRATVREHVTISVKKESGSSSSGGTDPLPGVYVEADDDTDLLNLAGSLSASGSVGVGATVVALVFEKQVTAETGSGTTIQAPGPVQVIANAKDDLWLLAIAFGASGSVGVAGGASVLVFRNKITAVLAGSVGTEQNRAGSLKVSATSESRLYNIAAAAGLSGSVGVAAVAVVTYFYNETISYVKAGSRIFTAGAVEILADSGEFVTADAAGASVSGAVSVGGTLDVVVTKVITKAYTEKNVKIDASGTASDVKIEAVDDYDLIAVVGTIAVSGTAGVGVSVLTTVSYNTVTAAIGENNTVSAGRDIVVRAASDRLVQGYVLTVGGGTAGIAASVVVAVAGSLLSDDAHEAIYVSDGELSALDPQSQTDGVFSQVHEAARGSKPTESLDDLLAGDGSGAEDTATGGGTIDYGSYGQDTSGKETDTGNMNDGTYDSVSDGIQRDNPRGAVISGTTLEDSTTAVVKRGSKLTAGRNVSVLAEDSLSAYMAAGALGGGVAGIGVGVSVAILYSNVQAVVEDNVTISVGGNVTVKAVSGSRKQAKPELEFGFGTKKDQSSTAEINAKAAESDKDNPAATEKDSTILVIGVTAGGGVAGVAMTVAYLNLMNKTYARMAGDILQAGNVTVSAQTNYGTVLSITLAAAVGVVGIGGSAAVTYFDSRTEASISGNAVLENITGTISVTADGTTNATAVSTAVGAGVGGVAITVSVAVNRSRFDAFIGQGVTIRAPQAKIDMSGRLKADARAIIASVSAGLVGVGVSVAVVINRPVSMTYIGVTPADTPKEHAQSSNRGTITVSSVTVRNFVDGSTTVVGMSVAAGGVAVNGAVALGFNKAKSYAAINQANVTASGDILVEASMDGDTSVSVAALAGGAVAMGAVVALAQIKSENIAFIDVTGGTVRGVNIKVLAGRQDDPYDTEALTTVITGSAGGLATALNFAVAINSSVNRAWAGGSSGTLEGNTLHIRADGRTKAYAVILNASVAGITANLSMSWATLSSIQEALLKGDAKIRLNKLIVESVQNQADPKYERVIPIVFDDGKNTRLNVKVHAMAEALIFSASEGVIAKVTANTAIALADAVSRAKVSVSDLVVDGDITVSNTADSTAEAKTDNLALPGIFSLGVMVGQAKARGTFEAILESTGTVSAGGDIKVTNIWNGSAQTNLVPASKGVQADIVSANVNHASAETDTKARAYITGNMKVSAKGDILVSSDGNAWAKAEIKGMTFEFAVGKAAVNVVDALVNADQQAYIQGEDSEKRLELTSESGDIRVNAGLKAESTASVGGNRAREGISVTGINGAVSIATAKSGTRNLAFVKDAVLTAKNGTAAVEANTESETTADAISADISVSLASLNKVEVYTDSNDEVQAYVDGTSSVTGRSIRILANGRADVSSTGAVPRISVSLVSGNDVEVTTEAAKGKNGKVTKAFAGKKTKLFSTGVEAGDGIQVKAESELNVTAKVPDAKNFSGIDLGVFRIKTYIGKTDTWAAILGIAESANDLLVYAMDQINAKTNVELFSAGLIAGGISVTGNTVGSQNAKAEIGAGASVKAWGNIEVRAVSQTNASSEIKDSNYGLGTNCAVEAYNTVTRRTTVLVGTGASVVSVIGNILIQAEESGKSSISSIATGSSGSAFAGGGPSAKITYNSDVTAVIGEGALVEAKYGTLDIKAIADSSLYAYAYRKAGALAGSNQSYAKIVSRVNVSTTVGGGTKRAEILGEYTTIGAYIRRQSIHAKTMSYTAAAGSKTEAFSYIDAVNHVNTRIDNAYAGGIEQLNVEAIVENQNLKSESYAEVVGATGKVYATSSIEGKNNVTITVTDTAELAGKHIRVLADAPDITSNIVSRDATAIANTVVNYVWTKVKTVVTKIVDAVAKIPLIGKLIKKIVKKVVEWVDKLVEVILYSDAEASQKGTFANAGDIEFDGRIHVGGGSAGSFIDIYDGSVMFSGFDEDLKDLGQFLKQTGSTIILDGLYNNDLGSITIVSGTGNLKGTGTIITNGYLPDVRIVNHTDMDLILRNLDLINETGIAPDIITDAEGSDEFRFRVEEEIPGLTVITEGKGSITFADGTASNKGGGSVGTDLGEGVLTVSMNGGTLRTEGRSFVAANKLFVSGAGQVGEGLKNPFRAYIFDISSYPGTGDVAVARSARPNEVSVRAAGDIHMVLTLVKEWMTREQMKQASGIQAVLNLKNIIGGKTVYVDAAAPKVLCADKPVDEEDYYISIPRSQLNFVTLPGAKGETFQEVQLKDAKGNPTDFWLTSDGMLVNKAEDITFVSNAYRITRTETYDTYLLPNGSTVVVDRRTNRLVRIVNRLYDEEDESFGSGMFDLSRIETTTETDGTLSLIIRGTTAEFDQKIIFRNGTAYMEIGINGATTYIEGAGMKDGTGWRLPNGITIFYKQVFLDEKTNRVVNGTFLRKTEEGDYLILLETIMEDRTRYHVAQIRSSKNGEYYTFREGYLYDLTLPKLEDASVGQTFEEAEKALRAALEKLDFEKLVRETFLGTTGGSQETLSDADRANAVRSAVLNRLKGIVTSNILVEVLAVLNKTQIEEKDKDPETGEASEIWYTTGWQITISLREADQLVKLLTQNGTILQKIVSGEGTEIVIGKKTQSEAEGNRESGIAKPQTRKAYQVKDGVYLVREDGASVLYVEAADQNGNPTAVYRFLLEKGYEGGDWYAVQDSGEFTGFKAQVYRTLTDMFFKLSGEALYVLTMSGSGRTQGGSLNGGYLYDEELHYARFIDDPADTKGIVMFTDRVLALFPDGSYSFVATQQKPEISGDGDAMKDTVAVAPGMTQKLDENGDPVYAENYMTLYQKGGISDKGGPVLPFLKGSEAEIREILKNMETADLERVMRFYNRTEKLLLIPSGNTELLSLLEKYFKNTEYFEDQSTFWVGAFYRVDDSGKKHYVYLEESGAVYVLQHSITEDGRTQYRVDGYSEGILYYRSQDGRFTGSVRVEGGYVFLDEMEFENLSRGIYFTEDEAENDTGRRTDITLLLNSVYVPGAVIVEPIVDRETGEATGNAYLHFQNAVEAFEASRDTNGYAIIDRYTRIVDQATEQKAGLPVGTLLFLNGDGRIVAYLRPDGIFRAYENENAYSEYRVDENGELHTTISAGSATYLQELAQDVFVSIYGLHENPSDGSDYDYDNARYFGYAGDGQGSPLVELVKLEERYDYVKDDEDWSLSKASGEGTEKGFGLSNGTSVLLSILNNTVSHPVEGMNGKAFFIMTDNTAVDSDGGMSMIASSTGRDYDSLIGDTEIVLGTLEGERVILQPESPGIGTVHITGGSKDTEIISDLLVLLSKGEGTALYGDSDNPLQVSTSGENGTVHVLFREKAELDENGNLIYTGDFSGRAYVNISGNAIFRDSVIRGDGTTQGIGSFTVTDGDVEISDLTLEEKAVFDLHVIDGNILLKNMKVPSGETGYASLRIKTEDTGKTEQRTGNLTVGGVLDAQGRVILDLSGSLLAPEQSGDEETTGVLILGSDVYENGSSFSFGGDIGSRELPLTVDVRTGVPFRIVTVKNIHIRSAQTEDDETSPLTVELGTSDAREEGVNIRNNGDVTVIQKDGDLYIGVIETGRNELLSGSEAPRSVQLRSENGSIYGLSVMETAEETGEQFRHANVTASHMTFHAAGDILDLLIDQVQEEGFGRLDAYSESGSIRITEAEGDFGLGVIEAPNGYVSLTAQEQYGLLDNRTQEQKEQGLANITAGGSGDSVLAGRSVGTAEAPIVVEIAGRLITDVQGDIYLEGRNHLNVQADTQEGKVYVSAEKDLTVSTSEKSSGGTGDLYLVKPAAGGSLTVKAAGTLYTDILDSPEHVTVEAGQDVKVSEIHAGGDIRVHAGQDVLAGIIKEDGDVAVTAAEGNILEGERGEEPAAVTGKKITLTAGGTIGTENDSYEIDTDENGSLSLRAGSAVIREISGDLTLVSVRTDGDFTLEAPGNVYNGSGDLIRAAAEARDRVDNVQDDKNLAETDVRIHEELILPPIREKKEALEEKEAQAQAVLDEKTAQAEALEESILEMEQKVLSQQEILDKAVETAKAQLQTMLGETVLGLEEAAAEIEELEALAEAEELTPEQQARLEELYILREELTLQQETLTEALTKYDSEETVADALTERIAQIRAALEEGRITEEEAQALLTDLTPAKELLESGDMETLQAELATSREAYQEAEAEAEKAREAYDRAHAEAEAARGEYADSEAELQVLKDMLAQAEAELQSAQAEYEAAKLLAESADAAVRAGGNIRITAEGSVGEADNALSVNADGTLSVKAGGDVTLTSPADLKVDSVISKEGDGNVSIHVNGSLTDQAEAGHPAIEAGRTELSALGGDIGTPENPFDLSTGQVKASADDIYLTNDRDLITEGIHADRETGTVELTVKGSLIGTGPEAVIAGHRLEAELDGSFGLPENPVITNLDQVSLSAGTVNMHNFSDTLEILSMKADRICLTAAGDVYGGGVEAERLIFVSRGHTGYERNPLLICVSGEAEIRSELGGVHYINSYQAPVPEKPEPEPGETPENPVKPENPGEKPEKPSGKPERKPADESSKMQQLSNGRTVQTAAVRTTLVKAPRTGDATPTAQWLWLSLLSMAAALLLLREKKRRRK